MKSKIHILVCIAALSVLPLLAGDGETKSVSVEQRFRETDLSLALRQYERVKMEAFESRLKLDLLDTDEEMTDTAKKKRRELLERRQEILEQRAAELRAFALKLSVDVKPVGAAIKAKAAAGLDGVRPLGLDGARPPGSDGVRPLDSDGVKP